MSRNVLKWRVECDDGRGWYEPIAAFNVNSVAVGYAKDCFNSPLCVVTGDKYRVTELRGNKWVVIWRS